MEVDLNLEFKGRQPQLGSKQKMTSNWKKTSSLKYMEDELNFRVNGRQPKFQRRPQVKLP